jgi:alpha-glucosidase (family GH31 glycosyl hydrolase)
VTGFPNLPPLFSLGFHYSRWEDTSASKIIEYNDKFEQYGFPLDVLWMDLGYTYDNQYFEFDPFTFPEKEVDMMRSIINVSDRRLVVITDPHIKYTETYKVYKKGL